MSLRLQQAWRGGHDGRPGWWICVEYDEDGIEDLKRSVPSRMRSYDDARQAWWLADEALDVGLRLVPGLQAHLQQRALL